MTIKVPLKHGLTLGDKPQMEAELRELTVGDILEAGEESEKLVLGNDGYELVQSPTLMGSHLLRRQIVRIGAIDGPFTLGQLKKLHPEDFARLQAAAQSLEQAVGLAASREVTQRGRGAPGGAGD